MNYEVMAGTRAPVKMWTNGVAIRPGGGAETAVTEVGPFEVALRLEADYAEWYVCPCDWCWGYTAAGEGDYFIDPPMRDDWLTAHPAGIHRV